MSPPPSSKPERGDKTATTPATGLIPVRSYDRFRDGKLEEVSAYTRRGVIQAKPRNNNRSILNSMWEAGAQQLMALDPDHPELDKTLDPDWMPETSDVAGIWTALETARAHQKDDITRTSNTVLGSDGLSHGLHFDDNDIEDIGFLDEEKKIHDALEDRVMQRLLNGGCTVERQVPFSVRFSGITAIPDILTYCLNKFTGKWEIYFIEIKTGLNPTFTWNQAYVFPYILYGNSVFSPSRKIRTFGFQPGEILPPIRGIVVGEKKTGGDLWQRNVPNPEFEK